MLVGMVILLLVYSENLCCQGKKFIKRERKTANVSRNLLNKFAYIIAVATCIINLDRNLDYP